MRLGLALILFAAMATPVAACLNDSELPAHEREFRSRYGEPVAPPPTPPNPFDLAGFRVHPMLLGAGSALLTGAFFVAVNGRGAKR